MFERISRGFQLFGETFGILKKDKEMILFPILSGVVTLIVIATFILPLLFGGYLANTSSLGMVVWVGIVFLFYLISYFVVIFFNTGLIACAKIRIDGGDPTFSDGIHTAASHLGQILAWAAVSATVGLVLQLVRQRGGLLTGLVTSLLGAAWSLVTFFVIPVMIFEDKGVTTSIKGSWELFKKTWGETVVGQFSLGVVLIPVFLLAALLFIGGIFSGSFAVMAALVSLAILLIAAVAILVSALQGIFVAIMYSYARTGVIPSSVSRDLIEGAFAPKSPGNI